MDQPSPGQESNVPPPPSSSFNDTILLTCGQTASRLAKSTSAQLSKLVSYSCHIGFLKACRDHHFIPKGLRLADPINTSRTSTILNKASSLLLSERLNHYRTAFANTNRAFLDDLSRLTPLLTPSLHTQLLLLNKKKSFSKHSHFLARHSKKFGDLLAFYNSPSINPYSLLRDFLIPEPTIGGPLRTTTPTSPALDQSKTVVNLSSTTLSTIETEVLSKGLQFAPTPVTDPVPYLAPPLQAAARRLGEAVDPAASHELQSILSSYKPTPRRSNLTIPEREALRSLQQKKTTLRFLPADKGNATVVLDEQQYIDKVLDHIDSAGAYSLLDKDPTSSLQTRLNSLLKDLQDQGLLTKPLRDKMHLTNPRYPQLYGQPKIHKPGAPIRPIVAFYNTPLSALSNFLSTILKPLSQSPLRLKDSSHFVDILRRRPPSSLNYLFSLDVVSLYTNCNMRAAVETAIRRLEDNPGILPSPLTPTTVRTLLDFCLDNAYFEFNHQFYRQTSGGAMGSSLTVILAEIRTAEIEQLALDTFNDPLDFYHHFVDDGIGAARDASHADAFHLHLNSLSSDLQYTIEHPKAGFLPYLDVLLHPDLSTSVYRKPTHTNLYIKYNSSTPISTRNSVINSLTRRAFTVCSPQHLDEELDTVYNICLSNGFPPHDTTTLMSSILAKLRRPTPSLPRPPREFLHRVTLPYHPALSSRIKRVLNRYDVAVTFSSSSTLRNSLTRTKSSPPPDSTPNVIYQIPCRDCPSFYIGQTKRPVLKRIKEHESSYHNNSLYNTDGKMTSAPAIHARETGHIMDWNSTQILASAPSRSHLNLLEQSYIHTLKPSINRTDKVPTVNPQWNSLFPRIATSKPRPAGIHIKPRKLPPKSKRATRST